MALSFELMDEIAARAVLGWRYEPPYDLYNTPPLRVDDGVQLLLDPRNAYQKLVDEAGEVVAYCCFGPDGQVPGGDYSLAALDIGLGLRPDLTGQGRGSTYVAAVLDFARTEFASPAFRVTVAEFNKRALKVWQAAGFQPVQTFPRRGDRRPFCILILKA